MDVETPEEIKKGLYLYLLHDEESCEQLCEVQGCPYKTDAVKSGQTCGELIYNDALTYIQQLETRLAQAERVRDAAVRAISDAKHYIKDLGAISYGLQQLENWDYSIKKSGVCEENTKEEGK